MNPKMLSTVKHLHLLPVRFGRAELIASQSLRLSCLQQQVPAQAQRNSKGLEVFTNKQNVNFEEFYRAQCVCGSEEEFGAFLGAARRGLPSVFRVLAYRPEAKLLKKRLNNMAASSDVEGLTGLSWAGGGAWKMGAHTRWDLLESDSLKAFHNIIHRARLAGSIYRQEQVSMVPVACLGIEPHHAVLDMCASPGSKTSQVLEGLHASVSCGIPPSGFVIANEPDISRCYNLVGNMKLVSSPCLLITNYEGQAFPDLHYEDGQRVLYDRIVCDVPCSGDGTLRKNPNVWEIWHPGRANHRHFLQFNIARRGVELLKIGGLMAYSSCSMNQIENESVVSRLLSEAAGGLELVNMTGRLPGLVWAPGLSSWRVFDTDMVEYPDFESVPRHLLAQICREMFPQPDAAHQNLEHCMRFLPHHNDDGGFFVAILRKTRPIQWEERRFDRSQQLKLAKKKFLDKPQVDNLLFFPADCDFSTANAKKGQAVETLAYYGSHLDPANLFTLVKQRKKYSMEGSSIFHTNPPLRSIITAASRCQKNSTKRLRLAGLGGQLMAAERRRTAPHPYRFWQDGLHHVTGLLTERLVAVSRHDLKLLLLSPQQLPANDGDSELCRDLLSQQLSAVSSSKLCSENLSQKLEADSELCIDKLSQQQPACGTSVLLRGQLSRQTPLAYLSDAARASLDVLSYGPCLISCELAANCTVHLVAFASKQKIELDVKEEVRKYYLFLLEEAKEECESDVSTVLRFPPDDS